MLRSDHLCSPDEEGYAEQFFLKYFCEYSKSTLIKKVLFWNSKKYLAQKRTQKNTFFNILLKKLLCSKNYSKKASKKYFYSKKYLYPKKYFYSKMYFS